MPGSLPDAEITEILQRWHRGDADTYSGLLQRVYEKLRRIAHSLMQGEYRERLVQPTEVLNEVLLRRVEALQKVQWQSREHFFAVVTRMMQHLLIDRARQRARLRHGGQYRQVQLEMVHHQAIAGCDPEVQDLHLALEKLAERSQKLYQVAILRCGGLEVREVAAALNLCEREVYRAWKLACIFLAAQLKPEVLGE